VAAASAGPYANLHLDSDTTRQHPTTQFFTGWMPFLPPNQQHQSTEGNLKETTADIFNKKVTIISVCDITNAVTAVVAANGICTRPSQSMPCKGE